jgi:branched-chain amino acid transport system ATP-binding protein
MTVVATMEPQGAPLLRAQGLHKSFGGVRAVSNISLDVPSGSIFAIIGPNGAGKSTLLNMIRGIYQPDSGSLSFDGHDLSGMRSHQRVRLGLARSFQKIRLFKQLSVLDNVIARFHVHHNIPAWQARGSRLGHAPASAAWNRSDKCILNSAGSSRLMLWPQFAITKCSSSSKCPVQGRANPRRLS